MPMLYFNNEPNRLSLLEVSFNHHIHDIVGNYLDGVKRATYEKLAEDHGEEIKHKRCCENNMEE